MHLLSQPFVKNIPGTEKNMTFFVILFFVFLLASLTFPVSDSEANPLTGKRTPASPTKTVDSVPVPSIFSDLISKITVLQMQLKQKIAANVHAFKKSGAIVALLPLFLFSLIYGTVHAAGPGHGKAIAMSYILAKGKGYRFGLLLGTLIAIIHAGSAISIVFFLRLFFEKAVSSNLGSATQITQVFSYGLIVLIGLYLLVRGSYSLIKGVTQQDIEYASQPRFSNALSAALAIGIIPCPGVIMILLFCLSLDQFVLGMLLSFAVSLGMAVTITVSVWFSITGKKLILMFTAKNQRGLYIVEHAFSCISGFLLTTMGGLFLAASIYSS